jgi:hypothetical protein
MGWSYRVYAESHQAGAAFLFILFLLKYHPLKPVITPKHSLEKKYPRTF